MLTDVFNANSASSPTDGTKWRAVEMVLPFGTLEPTDLSQGIDCA